MSTWAIGMHLLAYLYCIVMLRVICENFEDEVTLSDF